MRRNVIKLLLSLLATASAAVSLTASTFAYVLINNKVVIPDFDFNINGQEGLEISLDNRNWSKDILANQLKNSISDKFDDIKFSCTSIVQENGEIKKDANNQVQFYYDDVVGELNTQTNLTEYVHEKANAPQNGDKGFIKFDLYLRAKSTFDVKKDFNLYFTNRTNITSTLENVRISNRLVSKDNLDMTTYKTYNPGDYIKVDIANAIRLGIYDVNENQNGELNNYNEFNIYEITNEHDLGSVALESHKGLQDIYDPEVNAMYTYYNNYFTKYPFPQGAEDGKAFETKTRDDLLNAKLGEFKFNSDKNEYNVIKLEMYIWLEGWDADYFIGIPENTTITCNFEFEIKE